MAACQSTADPKFEHRDSHHFGMTRMTPDTLGGTARMPSTSIWRTITDECQSDAAGLEAHASGRTVARGGAADARPTEERLGRNGTGVPSRSGRSRTKSYTAARQPSVASCKSFSNRFSASPANIEMPRFWQASSPTAPPSSIERQPDT